MFIVTIRRWRLLGASSAVLAGFYHLSLAAYLFVSPNFTSETYGQNSVLEIPGFFLVLGAFQFTWAFLMLRERQEILIGIGTFGFLGSVVLYLAALATQLPQGILQQTPSIPALVAKIIEVVYVISSVGLVRGLSREKSLLRPKS